MREEKRRNKNKLIADTITFGGLYFALTIALAPISFLPFQVRVSDLLIPMSMIFGWGAIYGVSLGCFIANLFPVGYTANPLDIIFGTLANFLASYAAWKISISRPQPTKAKILLGCLASAAVVTAVVGSYLPYIILPSVSWEDAVFLGYLGVLPGELIAQVGLGGTVVAGVRRLMGR